MPQSGGKSEYIGKILVKWMDTNLIYFLRMEEEINTVLKKEICAVWIICIW